MLMRVLFFSMLLLLPDFQQPLVAVNETTKIKVLAGGSIFLTSLVLTKYFSSKTKDIQDTLDYEKETKQEERNYIEWSRIGKYISLWITILSGLYTLAQVRNVIKERLNDPEVRERVRRMTEEMEQNYQQAYSNVTVSGGVTVRTRSQNGVVETSVTSH